MASNKKKFGKKRQFLNPKDGVAAAFYEVEVTDSVGVQKGWPTLDLESNLQLSDCSRKIELEFNLWLADGKAEFVDGLTGRSAVAILDGPGQIAKHCSLRPFGRW